jgi:hypothetical protein
MYERKNAILCFFKKNSLKITAYDIHVWIHSALTLQEEEVNMAQALRLKSI